MVTPKNFFSILVLFLCTALGTQAQKTVSGRVLNQDSVALQQATVLLYLANDSTPLRVVSTDQWGMFRFQADTARYVLQVLHMGYVPYERALSVRGADQQTYIGDILLKESVKSLGEVSVSGEVERTVVRMEDDKEVYTLSSRVKRNAASAFMALADVPGIDVNPINNDASVRGSEGATQIMVNNIRRDKYYVQTIDPKTIERIEVSRFPSMRHLSRGVGALINIVTKEPVRGYSGNLSFTQDPLLEFGTQNANFTGVYEKWTYSLYGSNFYFDEENRESHTLRKTRQGEQWNRMERRSDDGTANMVCPSIGTSIDYVPSARSYSSLSLSYTYTSERAKNTFRVQEEQAGEVHDYFAMLKEERPYHTAKADFYHQTTWNKIHTLSVDANYLWTYIKPENYYWEMATENSEPFNQVNQYEDNDNMSADVQVNMEHKWKPVTLGEGYRFSWKRNDAYKRINQDITDLLYQEWRNSLYVDLSGKFHPKWFYRAGATMDIAKTAILGRSNVYADVMPSASLRYTLSPRQYISASYARSRRVPGMSMLNPTPITTDSVRVYQGNPDLLPVYSHSTTLGFYSYVKKLYLYLTLGYGWGNSFSSLSKVNDEGINTITYGRASGWKAPNGSIDIAWFINSWLKLGVFATASYSMYQDDYEEQFNKNLWSTSVMPYGTINTKRFYASFRFPVKIKQRTLTGYTKKTKESSLNMSYRLTDSWMLLLQCRYLQPLTFETETNIDGYYENYGNDTGRFLRVILGVKYSFRKGKSSRNRQRKVRTFESSSESSVGNY